MRAKTFNKWTVTFTVVQTIFLWAKSCHFNRNKFTRLGISLEGKRFPNADFTSITWIHCIDEQKAAHALLYMPLIIMNLFHQGYILDEFCGFRFYVVLTFTNRFSCTSCIKCIKLFKINKLSLVIESMCYENHKFCFLFVKQFYSFGFLSLNRLKTFH